jgi:aminopeptidase N
LTNDDVRNAALPVLTSLAQTDDNTLVRAAAIITLGNLKAEGNLTLFKQALNSESYAVQGAALTAISLLEPAQALTLAKGFEKDNKGALTAAIFNVYTTNGGAEQWPYVFDTFKNAQIQAKFNTVRKFAEMTGRVEKPEYAQQGIEELKAFGIKYKMYGADQFVSGALGGIKTQRVQLNDTASANAADEAIKQLGGTAKQ